MENLDRYREKAAEARRIAERMRFGEARSALFKVAEAFDHLAIRLRERAARQREAAD